MGKEVWIARDENGSLNMYTEEPYRQIRYGKKGYFVPTEESNFILLPHNWFPEIRWEDRPKKFRLTLNEE